MNKQRIDIFNVPIFVSEYEKGKELQKNCIDLLQSIEKEDTEKDDYCQTGYTSYGKQDQILYEEPFKDLLNYIGNNVAEVHGAMQLTGNVKLQNSWFSINRKHSYHEKHNHLPSTWSGVYYVQADENDAPIQFINQNLNSHWPFTKPLEANPFNSQMSGFGVKTGLLFIFPSYLEHKVEEQKVDQERITISFNFEVGHDDA